jgi:glycosyltransferase involved in cell wall biosynthesis
VIISVIVCTWNRASSLDATLSRMTQLEAPSGVEWEVLVVDNNSTDRTTEVLAKHAARLPLRALFEPRPGKAHALNRAVREAHGRYLIFTDDDVLPEPTWLCTYAAAFEAFPDCAVFGGRIVPHFEGSPPKWLKDGWTAIPDAFACRDLGGTPVKLAPNRLPYGANMAVRADVQRRYLYDQRLGPRPGSQVRGEETELVLRAMADGATGMWVPQSEVRHVIPAHRQTVSYVWRYYVGTGQMYATRGGPGNVKAGRAPSGWGSSGTLASRGAICREYPALSRLRRLGVKPARGHDVRDCRPGGGSHQDEIDRLQDWRL